MFISQQFPKSTLINALNNCNNTIIFEFDSLRTSLVLLIVNSENELNIQTVD